jgi:hypothetical protein
LRPAGGPRFACHRGEDVEDTNVSATDPAVLRTEPYCDLRVVIGAVDARDSLGGVQDGVSRFVFNVEGRFRLGSQRSRVLVRTRVASQVVNSGELRAERLIHERLSVDP